MHMNIFSTMYKQYEMNISVNNMYTGVFRCTASQRLHVQVKMYVTAYICMYFCTLQFVEYLVSTAAQSSKLVLSGGGLELLSLEGSSL